MTPCIHHPTRKPDPSNGYVKSRKGHLHRLAYIEAYGPIPKGMIVGHVCHDEDETCPGGKSCPHRSCINIDHLRLMTYAENTRAASRNMSRSEQQRKTRCSRGHERSPDNLYVNGACRLCAGILKYGKETHGSRRAR